MSKKNKPDTNGYVFSTDPDFKFEPETQEEIKTLPPSRQKLKMRLDTRMRAGKAVTLISGFIGTADDLESLGKKIKAFCGTGGSVKDGAIIIQGDQQQKIRQWLKKEGFAGF